MKLERALKGLLMDKGEFQAPGESLAVLAMREFTRVESLKVKLTDAWREIDQGVFTITKETRPNGLFLRWQVRKSIHDQLNHTDNRHLFVTWDKPESIAMIDTLLTITPDPHRVRDMMLIYEVAKRQLAAQAQIWYTLIGQANNAHYGNTPGLTPHHVAQARDLVRTLD